MSYGVALRNGVPFTLGTIAALCVNATGQAWSPLALWPTGTEPGMWIDPSNLTSQWQDSAGTTPVSTPGTVADSSNPVGLALDLRLGATALTDPGNHMLQATSTARPLLSARVNTLIIKSIYAPFNASNDMTDAGVVDSTVVHSGGTNTITCGSASDALVYFSKSSGVCQSIAAGVSYTYSFDINGIGDSVGKTVHFAAERAGGPNGYLGITLQSNPTRVSCVLPAGGDPNIYSYIILKGYGSSANLATGDAIEITNIQLNIGSAAVDYQYADTTALYTATGITPFQIYDGTDDGMATASFAAGTLTSAMDCMIAVRRDSGAATIVGLLSGPVNDYFGHAEIGLGIPCFTGVGTPTFWVDGVQLSGGTFVTANTLGTALTVGDWHIFEARGLDLSLWDIVIYGKRGASYQVNGARGDIMLFPSTASTEDKDNARQYLADKYGVTLA